MEQSARRVERVIEPQGVIEGAGVRLRRSIGTKTLEYLDPFLLLDHFASSDPADYEAGFPLHPHRGIETVTYLLRGEIKHKDTLGNSGSICAGDIQWMTAGGGLMHEEMPQVRQEGIDGFQLWVNLPARLKMTRPHYQELRARNVPLVKDQSGATVRIITGEINGVRGPLEGIAAEPTYTDVAMESGSSFRQPVPRGHHAFSYVFEGEGIFGSDEVQQGKRIAHTRLGIWGDGDYIAVHTREKPVRFLLVTGQPLNEPIARYGPFVMNTGEEIEQALRDLRNGTFVMK